jgi:hypothetical protein
MTVKNKCGNGFVYVASINGKPMMSKIGFTNADPNERVSQLKRDYKGFNFKLFGCEEAEKPKTVEQQTHLFLSSKIFDREIFNVSPSSAMRAVRLCKSRRFGLATKSNILDFSSTSIKFYEYCNLNIDIAVRRINKFLFLNEARNISDIYKIGKIDDMESFVMSENFRGLK